MTTLPRRAARDLRDLFTSPVAAGRGAAVSRRRRLGARLVPARGGRDDQRDSGGCRQRRSGAPAAAPAPTQAQASEFEKYWEAREHVALADSRRRREGADRQVQRLPVSAVPEFAHGLQADPDEVHRRASRAGALRPEGLPARRRVQQQRHQHDSPVGVRGGRRGSPGPDAQPRRADDRVDFRQSAGADARAGQAGRARGRDWCTDFDAKYAATLESVKSDIALGKQLGVRPRPPSSSTARKSMARCRRSTSSRRSSTSSLTRSSREVRSDRDMAPCRYAISSVRSGSTDHAR